MFAVANPAVNLIGFGLVVLGIALLVATLAFWRSAIEDPEVLAPLEVMGERRYGRANDFERFEILNDVRPGGPMPIRITSAPPAGSNETPPRDSTGSGARRVRRAEPSPVDTAAEPLAPAEFNEAAEATAPSRARGGRRGRRAPVEAEQWDEAFDQGDGGDETDAIVPPVIDPLLNFQNKRKNN